MSAQSIEGLAERASDTRDRIKSGLSSLRTRTDPQLLAADAIDLASEQGKALADRARTLAAAHPLALSAGVAAIGLAVLTGRKLSKARVDLGDEAADYTDYDDSFDPAPLSPAVKQSVERNPLISVLLGLAAGAVIGALMPVDE
jgi:hypothetical protein